MTKGTINRPGQQPALARPQRHDGAQAPAKPSATPGSSASAKLKEKKKTQHAEKPQVRRPHRQHRPHGAAHGAGGAHAADHEGEGEAHGLAGLGGAEGGDDLHRHKGGEVDRAQADEKVEHAEELHDTGAVGPDAIKRSKGGGQQQGGGDGFDQGKGQREAYERYLKGNVSADRARFDELRKKGAKDDFRPDKPAKDVEALGVTRATAHVVRLFDTWMFEGVGRVDAVDRMAAFLAGFSSPTSIKKVLAELESKPIRDVYPLEILMNLLEARPELLPGVRRGNVLGGVPGSDADSAGGNKMLAGVTYPIEVPRDVRLKSFALLGGGRPGYEFAPATDESKYTLLVDTPGRFTFAVLAATLTKLGRIHKESGEAILEIFDVVVNAMDMKGEPLSPEQWAARMAEERALAGDDEDLEQDEEPEAGSDAPAVEVAPIIAVQIRRALDAITRDETSGAGATTYSWDASFFRPGAPMDGEPILHLVVKQAGPFDAAWVKAREALAHKQKEFEPSRATVTQEDFAAALRRARVR